MKMLQHLTIAALLGAAVAVAAEPAANPGSDLGTKMQDLFQLKGRWDVQETYTNPKDLTGDGSARFDEALDDYYLFLEYKSAAKNKKWKLEGHGVFTYDEGLGKYRYWWFANLGEPRTFVGTYQSGKQTFQFTEDSDAPPLQRHTFKIKNPDEIEFRMETSADGKRWELDLTTDYVRKGKKKDEERPADKKKRRPSARG